MTRAKHGKQLEFCGGHGGPHKRTTANSLDCDRLADALLPGPGNGRQVQVAWGTQFAAEDLGKNSKIAGITIPATIAVLSLFREAAAHLNERAATGICKGGFHAQS
jgi:hypothetical protein